MRPIRILCGGSFRRVCALDVDSDIDVRGLLRQVRVPTLVVHCDGNKVVWPEHGRHIAAEIANARYVSLPSANHLLLAKNDRGKILLKELGAFLGWPEDASDGDAGY